MIENSFVFISMLSINLSLFACLSLYHFLKREKMLIRYKTLLVISKAFAEDAILNQYQEYSAQDLVNEINMVLDEN